LTKVFVTGASGFIGSLLADELLKKNYHVKCLVRRGSNLRWLKDKPFELVHGELYESDILKATLRDVEYVYHTAGATSSKTREGYFVVNRDATRNLIKNVYESNHGVKRFVYISSQAAVGPAYGGNPVDEETPYNPITSYGISKMEGEKVVEGYFDKLKCTIVRPPSVYGPRDTAILQYFQTINRRVNPLIGFGEKQFSLIHGLDLVRGIILAGESEKAVSNTYFITSEKFYKYREVGNLIASLLKKKVITVRVPHFVLYTAGFFTEIATRFSKKSSVFNFEKCKDMSQIYWLCSGEKARTELGFREEFTLEEGLRNTIEWYKKEGWLR
jgi:nucleoside-diphosphate-sugar epimerase